MAQGVAFGCTDVRLEEVPVLGAVGAHRLCVPLDANEPALGEVAELDSLYNPVGGDGGDHEAFGEVFDPLVMVGVDLDGLASGDLR